MKKALCLLLAVVTLLALCSCEAKSLESAQKALEKKDYYVEDLPMDEFFLDEMDGKILIAFEKKGVDPDQYSDWDGDALYQTKNFVWVFYCENETDAEDMYEQIKEVTSSFNERME
ncbi:MAG: hypothetical protein IKJ35_08050, partial [Clostridia bacterium]|nr:hypothetical protein [Clostridia bacterium]